MDNGSVESLQEGDVLLCRLIKPEYYLQNKLHIKRWNFVIATLDDGIVVKRIVNHDVAKGIITLHSLNPMYQDYDVSVENVISIFNVVQLQRKPRI